MNKRRFSIASLAVLTVLSMSCGSGSNFNLISLEEEWQLGNQLAQQIASQVKFNNDPQVNAYVRDIGQRIVAQTNMANLPWDFHVVEDPAINAFAIPGGHLYVNTGLIKNAENASELASVIAHEASHVVARHSTEQISRQYGLSVVAGLVLGQDPNALAQLAAQIVASGAMARFSREDEAEADELGQGFMTKAGYDPHGMPAMFRVLLAHQQSEPSRVEQFFATHPTTESRIREAEQRADKLAPGGKGITDEPMFATIRSRV
ncbi:MAG TPA: M48 family metallopeptidase [Thermoanaerobaculia bacterium]|nr:M48 family metallopeptidase [Thermoanaerobaculia bacterium]